MAEKDFFLSKCAEAARAAHAFVKSARLMAAMLEVSEDEKRAILASNGEHALNMLPFMAMLMLQLIEQEEKAVELLTFTRDELPPDAAEGVEWLWHRVSDALRAMKVDGKERRHFDLTQFGGDVAEGRA